MSDRQTVAVILPPLARAIVLGALLAIPPADALAQRLPLKAYSTADGLAHNTVNRIVRDSLGFLWFCTAGGLSRFDGYSFTNFGVDQGLPHADVTDFLETRSGEYWVATRAGVVRFDPTGLTKKEAAPALGTPARPSMFVPVAPAGDAPLVVAVTVLREARDGAIWVGTTDGLFRLDSDEGRQSLHPIAIGIPHDNVQQRIVADLLEDRSGTLWIATEDGLYRRWRDGTAARYGARDGLPGTFLQTLLEDHEGRLWAGTLDHGFFRFTAGDTHEPPVIDRTFTAPDLPSVWVSQLFETSQHRFWVATVKGLVEYLPAGDAQGRHFLTYGARNGLTYDGIDALGEDIGGSLWLSISDAGLMKLANSGLTTYGERDGLLHVGAIFEDRAHQLCFRGAVVGDSRRTVFEGARVDLVNANDPEYYTRFGCFDGRRFDWFTLAWGPAARFDAAVTSAADAVPGWVKERVTLQARSGEWWVGTGQGLYRFPAADRFSALKSINPIAVYTTNDGLAAWQVFRLFEDSHGNVWISTVDAATTHGLARWEPASQRPRDLANSPGLPSLKDQLARAFCEDAAGNIWIGFDNALARYANGAFALFTPAEGLPPGTIRDIHLDQSSRLWLASSRSGLVRVDRAESARPTFVRYTKAPGLSSDSLDVIVDDADGHMLVGGARGLDRLDATTGSVKHFSEADGLPAGRFIAAYRDGRGVLWFGTSSGLVRFEPVGDRDHPPVPPPIRITGLRIMDVRQPVSALGELDLSLPDLAPDQHQLQIDFSALSFVPGEVLRYQYELDDVGGRWSAPSDQRSVTYASLSPGRHTFRVRAVNSDGAVSAEAASVTFTVLTPLWLRWWFLTLEGSAFLALVYGLYRYRVARVLELAAIRTRIATDLHDDIGANLTRIAVLSEVAKQTPGDIQLESIAGIARESVGAMSDIVWAINPMRESVADLIRRMRQHAEEVFTLQDIKLRFNADGAHDSSRLGIDVRRELLLSFKEAVNNAARHSQCSQVSIDLRRDGSCLLLSVADDGVGFDTSRESQGQGLASLHRRAERLKGTFAVQSSPGAGTTVTLRVPL